MNRRCRDNRDPWSVAACDLMEIPTGKYLIVFEDLYTNWVGLNWYGQRTADGKTLARTFEKLILFRWETPDCYITKNGKELDN